MKDELLNVKQRFSLIGNSTALNHAIQVAMQVAPTDMTVLIIGESGTGKESFSKIIHYLSKRKHGQFIAVNCGAIPEGTIDSELFGHEKGAFTGAHESRKGYFEVTNGGSIFLDEIAEMPLHTQSRLLRVLENGEFIRVGSSKTQKTDVRVIAATNADLYEKVQKRKFREDLYYRLNTVPIYVPPLRERGEDILLIFKKFASDFADKYRVTPLELDEEAEKVLMSYRFPGNIRQLRNIVEQISVLEFNREIDAETLRKYLPEHQPNLPAVYEGEQGTNGNTGEGNFSERDILYRILFDMKKDMSELKKLVFDSLKHQSHGRKIINEHRDLFQDIAGNEERSRQEEQNQLFLGPGPNEKNTINLEEVDDQIIEESDATSESLSLEDKEKELIKKALEKNNKKRRAAARDLGISERTLYRKIKQYELE